MLGVLKRRQKQTSFRADCCVLGTGSFCCQSQVNHRALVPILKPPRPFIPWKEIARRSEESLEREVGGGEWVVKQTCILFLLRKKPGWGFQSPAGSQLDTPRNMSSISGNIVLRTCGVGSASSLRTMESALWMPTVSRGIQNILCYS